MKQFVFMAFLIAAGCAETPVRRTASGRQTGEPTPSLDCDAAIDQGIKRLTARLRESAPDPQRLENEIRTFDRIQGSLVRRCTVDSWPPEVTRCFATMERRTDLQTCQRRLRGEPSSKLAAELADATRSVEDRSAESTPPASGRRPAKSRDSSDEALDMLKAYKVALCNCNDHDQNCGKVATDAYQRAATDWAATSAGTRVDQSAKPDPELEALTSEIVDCSRRVFAPDLRFEPATPPRAQAARPAPAEDYAHARRSFHTRLLRTAPSPQPFSPVTPGPDARQIEFDSAGHKLRAWISATRPAARAPAVLFLHGGFAFGSDDWAMAQPFRDAGFVVMMPILRGENGSPGAFTLFYDEVDDVLAAAAVLATQPGVDPKRIYVSGHSAGGVLAMFAAMASNRFRAAAPLSAVTDANVLVGQPALTPFDTSDEAEIRMRSPLQFATSFRCPARLFVGDQENLLLADTRETARRAKASRRDVEAVIVAGDHFSMTTAAIPLAIAFFQQQR